MDDVQFARADPEGLDFAPGFRLPEVRKNAEVSPSPVSIYVDDLETFLVR